jgi:hypothetical protein
VLKPTPYRFLSRVFSKTNFKGSRLFLPQVYDALDVCRRLLGPRNPEKTIRVEDSIILDTDYLMNKIGLALKSNDGALVVRLVTNSTTAVDPLVLSQEGYFIHTTDHLLLDSAPNLGPLIQYLVDILTSSKIADTKCQDFRCSKAFVSAIFEFVKVPTRYEWSNIRRPVQ